MKGGKERRSVSTHKKWTERFHRLIQGVTKKFRYALGAAVVAGSCTSAMAAPPVSQMLDYSPRQKNVEFSVPPKGTENGCRVDLIKGQGQGSGWLLRDPQGQPLRYFFDSNGDKRIDIWSYYHEGTEVYREIDPSFKGAPEHYRWLNTGGSKWGIDNDRDGSIDSWKILSPEEASQEVLHALVNKDFRRLQALMITDEDIDQLKLPKDQKEKILQQRQAAASTFQETLGKVTNLSEKANWLHLETTTPQCIPADQTGSRYDIIKLPKGTVLYEVDGKSDWLQTGEMIQVGLAWKLISAPIPGAISHETLTSNTRATPQDLGQNPKLLKLIEELSKLDEGQPTATGPSAEAVSHYLKRADVLQRVVAEVKPTQREPWIRQMGDSLSTAVQYSPKGDPTAQARLHRLVEQIKTAMPESNLAAYLTFREMQANYSVKVSQPDIDIAKVQKEWAEQLKSFVTAYPNGEDTPDCLLQLGMVSEFMNQQVEAKNWYSQLVRNHPTEPQANKAAGAVKRLDLEGKEITLAGPLLADPNVAFDVDQLKGKVVIVYYWASWNSHSSSDFESLRKVIDANNDKVALLAINVDAQTDDARTFLASHPIQGTHLHTPGGLESKLATDHGVMVLPTVFLVDQKGQCVQNNLQIVNLEEEVKKLLK